MSRRAKKKPSNDDSGSLIFSHISKETFNAILGILVAVVGILLLMGAWGAAGTVGTVTYKGLGSLFGIGYYLLPLALFILAVSLFKSREQRLALAQSLGSLLFFISSLGLIALAFTNKGGVAGKLLAAPLIRLFGPYASAIILSALIIISLLVIFNTSINFSFFLFFKNLFAKKAETSKLDAVEETAVEKAVHDLAREEEPEPEPKPTLATNIWRKEKSEGFTPVLTRRSGKAWVPPPLFLLEKDRGKPGVGDIKANANIIKRTLLNFGIVVEMDEISIGPSVTRYALKPAEGVKLSRILGLQNNLELALAAHPVRIEAPIPGKSLVGIEVPNTTKATIGLGSLISDAGFSQSDKPLLVCLGRDIAGDSQYANLGKMPHLLIAGATGSGKSVTIHAIINSLLFRNPPENLKFIMIDPKRVELTLYNSIPHLLTPVITDPKKSILSLKWAAKEMERRYEILEKESVRDVDSYHKNILAPALKKLKDGEEGPDPMPYLVIVIDELADLMQTYPRELESAIVRLAQMSRAVGIHLIISTQRPSVNIITGLIKANIPARIALQVSSQIDSRTILDAAGAEKLLGAGDMLYLSGEMGKPKRIQSAFIAEKEVKEVVRYLKDAYADELQDEINLTTEHVSNAIFSSSLDDEDSFGGDDDDLYEEARQIVLETRKASTSFLQRKLRIGYARAARLIDLLEERGVVGPGEGAKPREVYADGAGSVTSSTNSEDYDEE